MAHKTNKGENTINKTFIFKAKCGENDIISLWKPAMEEYCTYYNKVSKWICNNLTTMKIGDLAQYIDNKDNTYYKSVTDVNKKDLPLYRIFKKGFNPNNANNALFEAIRKINPEEYNGNKFGLRETYYRREGYVKSVLANYRTKMTSGVKLGKTRLKKLDLNNVDDAILMEHCIAVVDEHNIESKQDFNDLIKYLKSREETPTRIDKINQLESLYNYYSANENEIKEKIENLAVENLKLFGGCVRKSMNSCTITIQDFTMECVGSTKYRIKFIFNKKPYMLELFGNRQVVRCENGERVELTNIVNNHGNQITFNIKNKSLFVHLTSNVEFSKKPVNIKNVVGVDVNIKHSMLATSIKDNGKVKDYINLYKKLVEDDDFVESFGDSASGLYNLELYRQMSETVNFGILETDTLFERFANQHTGNQLNNQLVKRENAMQKVFDNIAKTSENVYIVNYVNAVKMLRAKYKSYFILKEKYYEKQHEYDVIMGFSDTSTKSKETMDKRRFEFPFVDTDVAKELLAKLNNVEQDLIGCRDNIITYAFNVFKNNGYDTISLEYLDSSQFDKRKLPTPTPNSLLKYHKFEGKTKEEVDKLMIEKCISKDYYTFTWDNDKLANVDLSKYGKKCQQKLNFGNLVIKAIHFADVKDKFVQLTNNNNMNVVFCPAAFTSQMDSKTHKLYCIKNKNGKWVLLDKKYVRTQQETHINGLNADFNSACNIAYIASNSVFRENMTISTKEGKDMYNTPTYNIQKKFKKCLSSTTLNTFIKLGQTINGELVNGAFVECKK